MPDPIKQPTPDPNARKRAQSHFDIAEARTSLVKQMVQAENAARDAKTAKLRALRLAKEEADRAAVAATPTMPPEQPPMKLSKKRR